MASNDEVIQLEYVYDEKKDLRLQEGSIFSEPYYKDDSDSNDGDPTSNTSLSTNVRSQSKPNRNRRKSQYDEDNYALPDCESDGEVRNIKVDEQFSKFEEKLRTQGRQILIWRVTFIALIMLLSVMVAANFYLNVRTVETRGKTIRSTLQI